MNPYPLFNWQNRCSSVTGPAGARRLVVLHGGPGAHHDYLLPQMLELARGLGMRDREGKLVRLIGSHADMTIRRTLETRPAGATHWSLRSMARAVGHAPSTIHRIWKAFGLQPHRAETFKLSSDPLFVEKARDIVGLYLDPPDCAVVLCVDEKSQIQALDRTQPGLPLKPGKCGTMTHDYKRHGTTTLFAALNVLDGTVIGRNMARHRHQEFIRFLNAVEAVVPAGRLVHAILDNYASHKHPKVLRWLALCSFLYSAVQLCLSGGGNHGSPRILTERSGTTESSSLQSSG